MTKQYFLRLLLAALLTYPTSALTVSVDDNAGPWEKKGALDLTHYLELMLNKKVTVTQGLAASPDPDLEIVIGSLALKSSPKLSLQLEAVTKKDPIVRSDAIVLNKDGRRIYLAGSNDDSHYFAVSAFLHQQGCRWYTPTTFGEFVPQRSQLNLDGLPMAYASPFEIRSYSISWHGDREDYENFAHRNFYNLDNSVIGYHTLDRQLTKDQSVLSKEYVQAVADKLQAAHSQSKPVSVAISDRIQVLGNESDAKLAGGIRDKFFYTTAAADVFLPFYNAVCQELWRRNPHSRSKVGFLAYNNLTLPPQRAITAAPQLVAFLAPIDIDPNHAFGDARSPGKLDFYGTVERWVKVMQGRVILYDYDQGMLVWRDLPNPSHHVVRRDVKRYQSLGILGFATESRNAIATTFTNLFFRGQLYWNPNFNVDRELELFYKNFYGSNSQAMGEYWAQIYRAWESTTSVEHEFFMSSGLYTKELMESLRLQINKLKGEDARTRYSRLSFEVLDAYFNMTEAGAGQCDYSKAVEYGRKGLLSRESLTQMHGMFTTYKKMPEKGPAWWPGEVELYESLARLEKIAITPRQWTFRADPFDEGVWRGWGFVDKFGDGRAIAVDRLVSGQDFHDVNFHNPGGYGWYTCQISLDSEVAEDCQVIFPGVFNSCWLYINGQLVDWRTERAPWWLTDYSFTWKAKSSGALHKGLNTLTIRLEMNQHPSGLFRRPFLAQ